ncbi:hypothetical protein AX16_007022 [Volvariella volvacea WC 439]|nr:hypothetical protein AX16_007022 [Volvariella volvacea WC 439]
MAGDSILSFFAAILFTPIIRTILFRAILINAIVALVSNAILPLYPRYAFCTGYAKVMVFQGFVFLHHLASGASWVWVGIDYVLSLEEVIFTFVVWFGSNLPDTTAWSDIPTTLMGGTVSVGACLVSISLVFRTADLVLGCKKKGYEYFEERFNLLAQCSSPPRSVYSIFFGRALTRQHKTESGVGMELHKGILIFRRLVAIPIYFSLMMVAVYSVYIAPYRETGSTPTKHIHLHPEATNTVEFDLKTPVWNVLAFARPGMLPSNISVTPEWPEIETGALSPNETLAGISEILDIPSGDCKRQEKQLQYKANRRDLSVYLVNGVESWKSDNKERAYMTMWAPLSFTSPDLLISVNFEEVQSSRARPRGTRNMRHETVMLYLALTDGPKDVLSHTIPIYLSPGEHLVARVVSSFARHFRWPPLGALGFLDFMSRNTFLAAQTVSLTPDPRYRRVDALDSQATLRFVYQDDLRKLQIEEEYMEDTVISGLSKLGGLWTTLNGTFMMLFGTSLLMAIGKQAFPHSNQPSEHFVGSKSLSTFGFIHQFAREKVQERWQARYPQIKEDLQKYRNKNHKGLHTFLLDHFFNVDYFEDPDEGKEQQNANDRPHSRTSPSVPTTVRASDMPQTNQEYRASARGDLESQLLLGPRRSTSPNEATYRGPDDGTQAQAHPDPSAPSVYHSSEESYDTSISYEQEEETKPLIKNSGRTK